jgi:hypothetical protein
VATKAPRDTVINSVQAVSAEAPIQNHRCQPFTAAAIATAAGNVNATKAPY